MKLLKKLKKKFDKWLSKPGYMSIQWIAMQKRKAPKRAK